jgi:hypothetical protein
MPFPKGQSPNPGGKRKPIGLSRAVREDQGLKTWAKLLRIRDEQVLERKIIGKDREGQPIEADVVPSVKVLADVCFKILAYCWGTPVAVSNDELERRIIELEERLKQRQNSSWQSH